MPDLNLRSALFSRHVSTFGRSGLIRKLMALRRQRLALRDLDDHLLRDIGITREAAEREAGRPVWDPPFHWRC